MESESPLLVELLAKEVALLREILTNLSLEGSALQEKNDHLKGKLFEIRLDLRKRARALRKQRREALASKADLHLEACEERSLYEQLEQLQFKILDQIKSNRALSSEGKQAEIAVQPLPETIKKYLLLDDEVE